MIQGFRHRQLASQVLGLLKREREALKAGDIATLSQTSAQLSSLAGRLAEVPPSSDQALARMIEQIRGHARRNGQLIEASKRGLKLAQRLQAERRDARGKLSTYTGAGQRQDFAAARATQDRRT